MALDVGLILKIYAILVAQVIPIRGIRIVAVTHMIDVAALHEEHFALHLLARDIVPSGRIVLMPVNALHLDGLAIEVVIASSQPKLILVGRSVLYLDFAEAYDSGDSLNHVAFLVLQLAHQCIAVRSFCAPWLYDVACI